MHFSPVHPAGGGDGAAGSEAADEQVEYEGRELGRSRQQHLGSGAPLSQGQRGG